MITKNLLFYKPSLIHNLGEGGKGVNLSGYVDSVYTFLYNLTIHSKAVKAIIKQV